MLFKFISEEVKPLLELQGKYNTAQVFTSDIEETAERQIINLCNQEFVKGCKIRIMPDCHAGVGCVIGFTADLGDLVVPNLVGVDIGCGAYVVELGQVEIDLPQFDAVVRKHIPAGHEVHKKRMVRYPALHDLYCYKKLKETERLERSIGTLGGGNHFIELNTDNEKNVYLVIHSGSRNLGKQVASIYQRLAIDNCRDKGIRYDRDLCYLTDEPREQYLHDMDICQHYAVLNRETMANIIVEQMGLVPLRSFHTIHNYINFKDNIIRKGSVSAYAGEKLIIPINMRDGSILAIGKGNPEWNYSAPHGAGRVLSRSKAREVLSMDDYKNSMQGIYTTSVNKHTLDESPMAYKPLAEIMASIQDTVDILKIIKPIYNFKA